MVNNVTQALPVPLCKLGATGNDHLLLNWLKTKDSLYNAVIRTKGKKPLIILIGCVHLYSIYYFILFICHKLSKTDY